jgi:hypothetical protein
MPNRNQISRSWSDSQGDVSPLLALEMVRIRTDVQLTNHTKQHTDGSLPVKLVVHTLFILLRMIYMIRPGSLFSIVRLVGGFMLIVVGLSSYLATPYHLNPRSPS